MIKRMDMKYFKTVLEHIKTACIYFTVSQFFITAIYQLTAQNGTKGQFLLFEVELLLFLFSVVMAVIQNVFRIKKLSFGVKLLIHFFLCMAAVFLLFLSVTKEIASARSVVLLMIFAAVIYAVFAVIMVIIKLNRDKKEKESAEYKPMFKDKK